MKTSVCYLGVTLMLLGATSCADPSSSPAAIPEIQNASATSGNPAEKIASVGKQSKKPADFVPEGYMLFEEVYGDVNKDGVQDCIVVIKGTDKANIINHEYRGELDRNRRGIIVLLNNKGTYEVAAKNYKCFSSENEEGGVYFAPELSFSAEKGKLYVHYSHGRYGYWTYTFRFKNDDFELIGYDASSHRGPIVLRETSINFLSKKKLERVNINSDTESNEEVFEESWKNIQVNSLKKLSEIKDFDELNISY